MASVIENGNLYPPIIEDYMPAFVSNLKVNYSISPFNTADQFNLTSGVQISIREQNTNKSVIKTKYAPNEVFVIGATIDGNSFGSSSENGFLLTQKDLETILEDGHFKINTYYKVQVRFTKNGTEDLNFSTSKPETQTNWMSKNIDNFTEWSTVCLIRRISEPKLYIRNYNAEVDNLSTYIISGKVSFNDILEQEGIYSYKVQLQIGKDIVEEKLIYSPIGLNNREFYYEFKTALEDIVDATAYLYITTINGYEIKQRMHIFVTSTGIEPLTKIANIEVDEENGGFFITIKKKDLSSSVKKIKKIIIKRTDSRTGFNIWENVHSFTIDKSFINLDWEDLFIESGIWYKYSLIEQYTYDFSKKQIYEEPVINIFEHLYILGAEEGTPIQLKVKYNPNISSYKKNLYEQKIETIGGKYPFIRRNGDTNYSSFSVSGLITYLSEETLENNYYHSDNNNESFSNPDNLFISLNDLYGGEMQTQLYKDYNEKNNISKYQDIILEREFRTKVIDFLTSKKAKILKTSQEGNFIVKLMNINLTPEEQLGRRIYSFSCEAIEIADFTVENYIKYVLETIQEHEISKPQDGIKIEEEFDSFYINTNFFNMHFIDPQEKINSLLYDPTREIFDEVSSFSIRINDISILQLDRNLIIKPTLLTLSSFNEDIYLTKEQ